jgi:DNA anti-recombination protein RmuC
LDKIRDILFGAQMRDAEKKLGRIEERLLKEHEDLKADLRRRIESLEAFLRQEVESLTERLQAERHARDEGAQAFAQELREIATTVERRTQQLDEHAAKVQRELRQQILDQSTTLRDEFAGHYRQLSDAISRAIHELRVEKTDRTMLAALFSEVALRLSHALALPNRE